MQGLAYTVGIRVDGLYDANNDDMWYPGRIQHVHSSDNIDNASYEVLYDDGEVENHVLPQFLRFHVSGTLSVGTRVFGKYAGGDEWYPGKVTEVQENGCYTIEYDDSEVETDVPLEFIKEPAEASFESTAGDDNEQEAEAAVTGTRDEVVMVSVDYEPVETTAPEVAGLDTVEPAQVVDSTPASQKDAEEASSPQSVDESTTSMSEPHQRVVAIPHQQPIEMERPRFHAKPLDYGSISSSSQPQHQQQSQIIGQHQFETDEYASIVESIELLGKRLADAASIKAVLSTLVKQMRAFPQVTADLVHSRNGEKLVIDVLKFHDSHAVIQCYCFVLLRRLCFLCTKSTHFFLRNEIIGFVTTAMRKFAEDAILQASACGALAVFTRVHAGLNLLLEHRVAQLVLATIVYHKTYSIHTRQVHYYACEVLLELGELGDRTTLDALCGDQVDTGLSDVSPISLLLFLLRQGLSFDDKKACCAVGTLLMCLAANNRYAAGLILRLNGLSELSTVMAKYPSEPGIQKYSASASKEIALSSIQKPSPARGVKETASEILQESGSLEELHHERFQQQANVRANNSSNRPTVGGRSRTPGAGTGKRKTAPVTIAYPSPTRGQPALSYKDPLSFSKFASPIGKAPYLPSNMTSFTGLTLAQQRNSLVILDGNAPHGSEQLFASSSQTSERKQFVKEERQSLLFETYGVQSGGIVRENPGTTTRNQGIKRKQLRTHLVSAAESTWATPIVSPKKLMRDDMLSNPGPYSSGQPFSSRSDVLGMGSYASGSQRSYDDGGMDEPMMDDHQYYHHQQQYQQPTYRSSELSPTSNRSSQQQQQQQTIAKKKKKKSISSSSGGGRESFQIKIESETQLRISKELRSPFASPISPSHKRSKAAISSSKTGVRSSHGVQRSSTVKKPQLRHDSESLNAYAAKLFNEDFGCLDGDETNGNGITSAEFVRNSGLSAREQAEIQERERLSFAEKLHKMIDKAKSTLAVSNVTSEPMPCFPRSTTSSKSSNGSKSSLSRLPAEISVPHVAVGERPVAPTAKKTRVPSSSTTPRQTAKETTTVAGESSVASTPSELSTSSQSKSQAVDSKKHTISGSKISSLSAPKKPLATLPAASTKSYNSATAGSSAVSRTGKLEPGRPVQTPKSASKTKPTVSSSSKSANPMTPAVPVLSPASAIEEPRDDLVEAEKSADVKEETSQDDITESPMPEPSIELSSEVEAQVSAFETEVSTEQGYLDAVPVPFPPQLEQHGESLTADENAAVAESESKRPAELQEVSIAPLESEPAPPVQNASTATTTTSEEDVVIGSVNETTSHEEGASLVETPGEPAGSVESTGSPPEPIEPASLDPEIPADAEALANPDPESGTENDDVQPSATAVMEEVNASIAVESSSSTSDASPLPPVNEALVDDIYADEYNEFDDDGAGDEATAAEALDEQIVDDADDGHLGGKGSLDDLLSMADQVIGAPQPAAVEPELFAGAEETDAVDAEPSPVLSPEDDNQPLEIDSVEQKALSSSTSGDDLGAGESGSISASLAEDVKAAREQAVVMDDGLDAATSAAPFEEGIVVSESQTEDRFSAPAEPVAEGLGEEITTAFADERPTATLETSEQPPINRDEQGAPEAMTTEALSESPSSDEVVIDKGAAADSEEAPSPAEIDETKDSEDTAHRTEAVVSSEIEAEESSRESGEAPSAIDEAGESSQAETTANEPIPVSGESVVEEAKAVDERPVSRGVDSYAEDSFDFEPEEEGRSEKATPTEDSDNQKNIEMGESDVEASVPVVDAVEPTELPQKSVTETEAEADVNQEGDQSVNANDYQEAAKKAALVVDEEATPAASREPEEADAISEAVLTPAGDEIEPPSASEYTADAERIEEQTSAGVTDNPSAEDTAPSDEAAEAAAVDADGTTEEAQGASEDAPVPAEATEATDDADEYGEEYGDADFEETVEGGVQDDGTGDASASPSVVFAPSEEVPLESVSERYEQLPAEPVPVDEISLEQTDEVVVPASEEATSETTDHPLGGEPAAADTVVDATDDDAVQDVETAPANDDSEPVVESVPEFRENPEIDGDDATVVSDAQVNVKAEDFEVVTGAMESEQGDAGKYPEIYGEESEFVDEEDGTQTSESIDATAAELLVYTEVPGRSETEETAQQPADEPAGESSPESSVAVSEDPIVPGDSSAAEEINGENDESEPTAEPAVAPTVQLDAEQMDHGGQADNLVDEPAYEDDYSGDAADLAGEEALSVAPLEVESGQQIVLSVESNADNEGERNSAVDSDPAPSVGGESGTQGGDDLLGGQDTVIEVANEPESSQFTAEDALPDVEDQLPVDSIESVVAVSDGTEEELKLETPAIERVVSSEGKPTSRPDEPDSASVAPEREQESTDADEGYEDYGEFEEGEASQEQQPAADEPQAEVPEATTELESSSVSGMPEPEMDANPEAISGVGDASSPEEVAELADVIAADSLESAAVDEEVADLQEAAEETISADDDQQEKNRLAPDKSVATAGAGKEEDEPTAVEAPSQTAALKDESTIAAPEDEANEKGAATDEQAENSKEEVEQPAGDATAEPETTEGMAQESEAPVTSEDAGHEVENSKQLSVDDELTASGEPEATSPQSVKAISMDADQNSDTQDEEPSTETPASADTDTAEVQSLSEPVDETVEVELETLNSDEAVSEVEQVSSEEPPSGVNSKVTDSEPQAQLSESDTRGDDADDAAHEQQLEAEAAPEPSEPTSEEKKAAIDEAVSEDGGRVQADSMPESERTELEASQPGEVDVTDDIASELEPTQATAEAPTDEPSLLSPPEELLTDEQQPETDEAESPKTDEYDDFEAEAEAIVTEITPAVENFPPAPDSADAYDDFEAEAAPVVLQVQLSSDTITSTVENESPGSDLYDDFEGNDGDEATPTIAALSESPEEKNSDESSEKPTVAGSEDEADEYAEETEYNDFEEDDEKPSLPAAEPVAATIESPVVLSTESSPREVEDDGDVEPPSAKKGELKEADEPPADYDDTDYAVEEEEFENEEKPSTTASTLSSPKPAAAMTPAAASASEEKPAAQEHEVENEYEADYDAEYDDFED